MLTSFFAVFTSQKLKDWTAGPVFCGLGPVWLWSFSSHETGLPNTNPIALVVESEKRNEEVSQLEKMVEHSDNTDVHYGKSCQHLLLIVNSLAL